MLTGIVKIVDGICCNPCWEEAGFDRDVNSLLTGQHYSAKELHAMVIEQRQNNALKAGFSPTKTIKHTNGVIEFDDNSKTFIVTNDIFLVGKTTNLYRYDQIRAFKLIIGQNSKSSGNIGRGAIGGTLFGDGGAVVGAMSDISTKKECTSLRIKLTFKNSSKQTAYISFINSSTSMGGLVFRQQYQAAQAVLDLLSRAVESYKQAEREEDAKRRQAEWESFEKRQKEIDEEIAKSRLEREERRKKRDEEFRRREEERERERAQLQAEIDAYNRRVEERKKESEQKSVSTTSAANEIRQYKQLLDEGIITEEEFQAKKKQLLGL